MPSATQIRSNDLARQTVLSATSPLKLFSPQSTDSAAQTNAAFSSFGDALAAARQPDPNSVSAQSASIPAPTADDTQSTQDADSQAEDENSADESEIQDATQSQRTTTARTNKKVRSNKTQPATNTPATAAPANNPTAAPAATDPAAPTTPTAKSEKKPTADAGPTAQSPATTDAATLAAQQLAAANAPIPRHKSPVAKPKSTGTDESAAPAAPAAAEPTAQKLTPLANHTPQTPTNKTPEKPTAPIVAETCANKDQQKQSSTSQDNSDPQSSSTPHTPQLQSALKPTLNPAASSDPSTASAPTAPSPSTAQPTPTLDPLAQSIADSTIAANTTPTLTPGQDIAKPSTTATTPITDGTSPSLPTISTDRADAASSAQQPPETDPEQTFQQVVAGLRGKMDPTSGKAEISLNPPNLGTLHVSISLSNGSLTAQFQSSSDVVRDLLKSNMEKLKTVLEGQGIAVDKLAVEAPAGKVVAETAKNSNPNSPNNDGRSAGQYTRDQSNPKRSQGSQSFARLWQGTSNGAATQEAPIDIVG